MMWAQKAQAGEKQDQKNSVSFITKADGTSARKSDESNLENQQGVLARSSGPCAVTDESLGPRSFETSTTPLRGAQSGIIDLEEIEVSEVSGSFPVIDLSDDTPNTRASDLNSVILIDTVIAVWNDVVYMNERVHFSLDVISEGFVPYKGDWLEVEYSIQPGTSKMKIHSVKPIMRNHVKEARVTSVDGRNGVIDDSFFFTLDTLICPKGYVPQVHDVVSVDIVESDQKQYLWRAFAINPIETSL
ncbi:cancer/testis antigen 55-like [Ochotona princeps]|uniref:cancer/testis antigen 55-like n=1 Tax=Ochotona princeps TaxID=9978 RepID=UPI002714EE75|nr:cancer/testis antigen 55-like [Ochotona princeps]